MQFYTDPIIFLHNSLCMYVTLKGIVLYQIKTNVSNPQRHTTTSTHNTYFWEGTEFICTTGTRNNFRSQLRPASTELQQQIYVIYKSETIWVA